MEITLSAILPTWNRADLVPEAIRSALSQTRPPDEIIVVDDGSTDETSRALEPFGERIRVIRTENQGAAQARSTGVRASASDYIAFLDADDLWLPEFLEMALGNLARHSEPIGLLSTKARGFTASPYPIENASWKARLFMRNHVCTSTAIVSRKAFEAAGGFWDTDGHVEDYGLWLRLASLGKVLHLSHELGVRRRTIRSRSASRLPLERDRARLLLTALDEDKSIRDELGNLADHRIAHVCRKWAKACLTEKLGKEARNALAISRKHNPLDPRLPLYWIASWNPIKPREPQG